MSDPLAQIGPRLRQAREALGLAIDEAAKQAQVPRPVAEALEAEDFSQFPSPVYAKSFLLQYSEFLQVDAKPWLDALAPGSFMASGTLLKGPEVPTRRQEPSAQSEERGGIMAVILMLLVTAAMIYGGIKGYEWLNPDRQPVRVPAPGHQEVTPPQPLDGVHGTEAPGTTP